MGGMCQGDVERRFVNGKMSGDVLFFRYGLTRILWWCKRGRRAGDIWVCKSLDTNVLDSLECRNGYKGVEGVVVVGKDEAGRAGNNCQGKSFTVWVGCRCMV